MKGDGGKMINFKAETWYKKERGSSKPCKVENEHTYLLLMPVKKLDNRRLAVFAQALSSVHREVKDAHPTAARRCKGRRRESCAL